MKSKVAFGFNLFAFFICFSLYAQGRHEGDSDVWEKAHRIQIVDEEGVSLPYVHAFFEGTKDYVLANDKGFMLFLSSDLSREGYLVFNSGFYSELRVRVDSLLLLERIVLLPKLLGEVVVYPDRYWEKEMEKVARYFADHYARDYVSKVTTLYTVECNGKYREFAGFQGIFGSFSFTQKMPKGNLSFQDKNSMGCMEPLTTMKSDRLMADSDEILSPDYVYSDKVSYWEARSMKVGYFYTFNTLWPLRSKRSLEIFSPLNPKQIRNYEYREQGKYDSPAGEVSVVKFRTKKGVFPKKTKLYGEGEVYYLKNSYRIIKVVTENIQDFHTTYNRWRTPDLLPSATQYCLEVVYGEEKDHIYTQSVSCRLKWVEPKVKDTGEKFYRVTHNPRRNPVKHKTEEYFHAEFSDVILFGNKYRNKMLDFFQINGKSIIYLYAPFDKERWEFTPMPGIDRERLFRDLDVNGKSLYQQAEENGLKLNDYHRDIGSKNNERYEYSRNMLYPFIYGKEYKK